MKLKYYTFHQLIVKIKLVNLCIVLNKIPGKYKYTICIKYYLSKIYSEICPLYTLFQLVFPKFLTLTILTKYHSTGD